MSSLLPPWSGLSLLAPRVDLSSVVRALRALPPERQSTVEGLRVAGLAAPEALRAMGEGPWRSTRRVVRFLHAADDGWPERLDGVPFGPVALALQGDATLLQRPGVAVVGARACTAYGREWAGRIASGVVGAGGVVVSGLAAGVDLAAHAAAGGATIAVLGQGIDARMPAWQQRARDTLLARGGLVVSEVRPDVHATPFTFPVRNRIIAALARAVVVVEAGERSGARNTATHALRIGRDLLAVPGPLGATASVGCLDLLEQGAAMVRGVHTVLAAAKLDRVPPPGVPAGPGGALLAHLAEARTPDELAAATGLGFGTVMEALGMLELTGRAIRLPGRRYQLRSP